MLILILIHILIILCIGINIIFSITVTDESTVCNTVFNLKNELYLLCNIIFLYVYIKFFNKKSSSFTNIIYFQNISKYILILLIFPIAIMSQIYIPKLFCKHIIHRNIEIFAISIHLLFECIFIHFYTKCLIEEFKVFSNFK